MIQRNTKKSGQRNMNQIKLVRNIIDAMLKSGVAVSDLLDATVSLLDHNEDYGFDDSEVSSLVIDNLRAARIANNNRFIVKGK